MNNSISVGTIAAWGCDIIEVCSIQVRGFVNVRVIRTNTVCSVHISQIETF